MNEGIVKGSAAGYKAESEGFSELGMTSESVALRSIFFGQVWLVDGLCVCVWPLTGSREVRTCLATSHLDSVIVRLELFSVSRNAAFLFRIISS